MIGKETFSNQESVIFSLEDIISSSPDLNLPSIEECRMISKKPEEVKTWSNKQRLNQSTPAIKKGGNLAKFRRSSARFANNSGTLLNEKGEIINQLIVKRTPDTIKVFKKKFAPLYEKLIEYLERNSISNHLTNKDDIQKSVEDVKKLFDESKIMDYFAHLNNEHNIIDELKPSNTGFSEINKGSSLAFLNTYFARQMFLSQEETYNMGLASMFEPINEEYLWQSSAQHLPSFFEEKLKSRDEILTSAGIDDKVRNYLNKQYSLLLNIENESVKLFQVVHDLYVRTNGGRYKVESLMDHITNPMDLRSALGHMVSHTSVENRMEAEIDTYKSENSPDGGDVFYSEPTIVKVLAILGQTNLVNRGKLLRHEILNNCKYANKLPNWITVACLNPAQDVTSPQNPNFCKGYFNKPFTLGGKNYNTACKHGCDKILSIKEKSNY